MANPHVAPLEQIPGSERFTDITRHTDNELFPGMFMFRVEASLLYLNVESIDRTVLEYVLSAALPFRLVVCDLSTSPYIDAAGARMLARFQRQLANEGIQFRVADAHAEVRDILCAMGVDQCLGRVSRRISIQEIVSEFQGRQCFFREGVNEAVQHLHIQNDELAGAWAKGNFRFISSAST